MNALRKGAKRRVLLENGEAAQATILKIWDTGAPVSASQSREVGFQLEVLPVNRLPYQAEADALLSHLDIPRIQPGAVVNVKIDPQDTTKVALDLNRELWMSCFKKRKGRIEDEKITICFVVRLISWRIRCMGAVQEWRTDEIPARAHKHCDKGQSERRQKHLLQVSRARKSKAHRASYISEQARAIYSHP